MKVIKITPRGYCYGVVDAIQMARTVARDPNVPRPIYILGQIVHNRHAVASLAEEGIINLDGADRLSLLDQIDGGTVVFTAHGVSPQVKEKARAKGLTVFDATCPDVTRTHNLVKEKVGQGYEIIYIGKKGHPEPEGTIGEAPGHVHLVETEEDLAQLELDVEKIAVVTQTTLSQWDTEKLITKVLEKYPQAEVHNEICLATQQRQEAVATQAKAADVVLVVGDTRSNNSNRLVQVAQEIAGRPAYLVDNIEAINPAWLEGKQKVAVTAGSSTPTHLTRAVIEWLEQYEPAEGNQAAGA